MDFKHQKGQTLIQYLILAVILFGLTYALTPVFKEADKRLTSSSSPEKNQNLNREGLVANQATHAGIINPSSTASSPVIPPTTQGPPPPTPAVGKCGPDGCGTIDLSAEENTCGTIPGPAGVLEDGCWICDSSADMWYWDEDTATNCPNYWYGNLAGTCSEKCMPNGPPSYGRTGSQCYICINNGSSEGLWAYWHEENDCRDFWEEIPPSNCFGSDDAHYNPTCGCSGVPPLAGWYVDPSTSQRACWVCDDTQDKWINTIDSNPPYCQIFWRTESPTCVNYVKPGDDDKKDFPFCGCTTEPIARGPNPLGTGECWVCYNGNWVKETAPEKCTEFWVNDNCPSSSEYSLTCGNSLPGTSPGTGNCWLCTNPTENYRTNPYNASDPLYSDWGEPCNKFWSDSDYPGYLNIPQPSGDGDDDDGDGDDGSYSNDVNNVCKNNLTDLSFTQPGIAYNPDKDQWGCWLCTHGNQNFNWVYWEGDRFADIAGEQYQACHEFWIEGNYPDAIPPDPVTYQLIYEYGGTGYETGRDVVVSGNHVYITGSETSDPYGGSSDIVVKKIDKATGEIVWKKQYGGSHEERGLAIVENSGTLYVTGYESSDDQGGNYDIVVMKLDSDSGNVFWKKQYGGTANDKGYDLALDPGSEEIYVTGYESSDVDGGKEDIFVMKLNSSGSILWKKQFGGAERDIGYSLAFSNNMIYVTGYEMSDNEGGLSDVFVMKLDSNGNVQWKRQYGGANTDRGYSIAVSQGEIYITGYEMSDSDGGNADVLIMKLENNGEVIWKNQYGGSGVDKGYSLAVDNDFIYVTGEEDSDPEAGANYDPAQPGKKDLFVMKVNKSDGAVIWKQQHGGVNDEVGRAIFLANGYLYITGEESSDEDGGVSDILFLAIPSNQSASLRDERDINDWTLEGTSLNTELINDWTANETVIDGWSVVSNEISGGTGGWTSQGNSWNINANIINDGAGGWPLEGITINDEKVDWSPLTPQGQDPPPPPPPSNNWKRQYGGNNRDIGRSVINASLGEIFICGEEQSDPEGGQKDIFILKIDEDGPDNIAGTDDDGQVIWGKQYGGPGDDVANSISRRADSLYITGYKDTVSSGKDILVLKINRDSGYIAWKKQLGGSGDDYGFSISSIADDVYVAAVEDNSALGGGGRDLVLMKLNRNFGDLEWVKQYGGEEDEIEQGIPPFTFNSFDFYNYDRALYAAGEGFLYLVGDESSYNMVDGNRDIFVMKVNSNDGTPVWIKQWGGEHEEKAYSLAVSGENLYVCGEEESDENPGGKNNDIFVMKLDGDGNTIWKKQYGGGDTDVAFSIVTENNYIYVSGKEKSDPEGGNNDIFVMKLDDNGNVIWKNQYGGTGQEIAYSSFIKNNYLYITGYETSDFDGFDKDVVLMKIDINQPSSNIVDWNIEHDITLGFKGWDSDGDDITVSDSSSDWNVAGDDISASWHNNDINDWVMNGANLQAWEDINLDGSTIDKEIIDEWTVGQ